MAKGGGAAPGGMDMASMMGAMGGMGGGMPGMPPGAGGFPGMMPPGGAGGVPGMPPGMNMEQMMKMGKIASGLSLRADVCGSPAHFCFFAVVRSSIHGHGTRSSQINTRSKMWVALFGAMSQAS